MMKLAFHAISGMAALCSVTSAQAEVTNTAANGFTVQHQTEIAGNSDAVWKALIAPSRYWNGDHSWTGNAENFYLVPQAGGCFCELIRTTSDDNIKSSDGSVQHMRVIYAHNGKMLRMSGALGPLQGEAVTGTLTVQLQPQGDATVVRFTYKVGGYMEFPVDQIAPAVDGVIGEQLARLSALFSDPDAADAGLQDGADEQIDESASAVDEGDDPS
ncbi:SRPBCC family protein [uncultured Parasphingorhabdus sp.]|uniref:SRPBCC family protein n=1 Tax=uncultured Parasphingorhabdus sp. TaxID=2709694 RepID=UPI0030D84AF8